MTPSQILSLARCLPLYLDRVIADRLGVVVRRGLAIVKSLNFTARDRS
jgi:hypothetical protein